MQKDCTNISLAEVTKLIVQINPLNSNTENTDVQKLRVNFSILALKAWSCPLLNVFSKACNGLTWNGFKTAALKTGFYILDGKKSIKKPSKLAKTNQIINSLVKFFQILSRYFLYAEICETPCSSFWYRWEN